MDTANKHEVYSLREFMIRQDFARDAFGVQLSTHSKRTPDAGSEGTLIPWLAAG
jgi:hypothetical protein